MAKGYGLEERLQPVEGIARERLLAGYRRGALQLAVLDLHRAFSRALGEEPHLDAGIAHGPRHAHRFAVAGALHLDRRIEEPARACPRVVPRIVELAHAGAVGARSPPRETARDLRHRPQASHLPHPHRPPPAPPVS